jgi:hypothetical protein
MKIMINNAEPTNSKLECIYFLNSIPYYNMSLTTSDSKALRSLPSPPFSSNAIGGHGTYYVLLVMEEIMYIRHATLENERQYLY